MTSSFSEADKHGLQFNTDHGTGSLRNISQSEEMHMFVDTYPEGIVLLTPVYSEKREVIDFVYSYINRTAEEMLQRPKKDMIGRTLMDIFPGTETEGIFKIYVDVFTTGKTNTMRFHYSREGFDTWFGQRVEKFENGILIHTTDMGQMNQPLGTSVISEDI